MKLLSEIVAKKVVDVNSGKVEGTIYDIVFSKDFKRITFLKMFDKEEEEYLIPTTKIYNFGQDAVVIRNKEALLLSMNLISFVPSPINLEVYSILGEYLGRVLDAEIEDNFVLKSLVLKNKKIPIDKVLNINESVIINTLDKKIKISSFKVKSINIKNQENVVSIMTPQVEVVGSENYKINLTKSPEKVIGNSDFLLGRIATKTIYGINHEIILRKENSITKNTLEIARKHGKIAELTIFSKKR